jgi:hypothetical protein
MWAVETLYVRLLGLHNGVLAHPQIIGTFLPDATWRHIHEVTCRHNSDGYLFHAERRNCWAVVTWPGESSDVTLCEPPPVGVRRGERETP